MDLYTDKIQSKMLKIEKSLLDLTNEIKTTVMFLFQLKENSSEIVKNLNSMTAPEMYLNEFINASRFILKYLNFLTEVNCKFEMLEISEKNVNTSIAVSEMSEILPENISKAKSASFCGSTQSLNFIKDFEMFKIFSGGKLDDSLHSLNVASNNENESTKNSDKNELSVNLETKPFDLDSDYKEKIISNDNETLYPCSSSIRTLSDSESSSCTSSFSSNIKDNAIPISSKNASSCNLIDTDSLNTSSTCKVQDIECQSVATHNFETESVPIKLPNLDTVKDLNCTPNSNDGSMELVQLTKPKETQDKKSDIKPIDIVRKIGKEYDVVIENVKSPSEFYVSFKNCQSNLAIDLEKKLRLLSKTNKKLSNKKNDSKKAFLNNEFGKYALYYSKCDEMWYRAEITNWCLNFTDNFATIFLLDYGESKCVHVNDLQFMPEDLKKYPAFAQRCHLHGILPLDMNQSTKNLSWEKGSTEKMRSLIENSERVRIRIAPSDCFHPDTSLPVTLWLVDQNNQCVNKLLVESKFALASDEKVVNGEEKDNPNIKDDSLLNWNPMKEDFESYQNSYELDITDPAAIIYGYVGNDYKRICPFFAKTGSCFKGEACKKEHQKLDPLGFTTDQEEIYNNAFSILPVPPPKAVISVQVTCLLAFNQFCCLPKDSFLFGEENLHSLVSFMNKAENIREMKKLLIPPSPGQIVIARYSEDCSWYRARVLESQPENDFYTVLFVDYGNTETLKLSSIRAIEARYLHLPFQAMHCFIYGVERNPKVLLKDVMEYINERIYSGHITIEVVSRLPGEGTNLLVHAFDQNGKNIGDDLIAMNYAISKDEIIISTQSESIPG